MTRRQLSPAMQKALTGAYLDRDLHDGAAVLSCRIQTARALVARGMAVPRSGHGHVLSGDGEITAASLIDNARPELEREDVVVYHGSILDRHGREYIVLARNPVTGRYSLVGVDGEGDVLRQVRRTSITYTGQSARTRYPEIVGAVEPPAPGDVQVATASPEVNAYRKALARLHGLPAQVESARDAYDSYARMATRSTRQSIRDNLERRRRRFEDLDAELRGLQEALPRLRARAERANPAAAARARLALPTALEARERELRRRKRAKAG
ncbi:hypothetical protein [Thermomonospora cellulosilytica]|uniref:Uncharacterized protein n=1 Tax=Thermomonospora cellulosilytica TaxID=1411118 RepID=A0A7W3N1K9_9ACTN|nr:hypothetical protein [Thermomonospora cellulosilytica]MBA9005890.1 hypothetical protein [Thermomonospora cellulosilytica]